MPIDTALVGALHVKARLGGRILPTTILSITPCSRPRPSTPCSTATTTATLALRSWRQTADFGLGTLDALDGEMVALDGGFYQIRADGRAYAVDGQKKTPFAVVTFFEPALSETLGTTDLAALCERVDRLADDASVCCGVRVSSFGYVRTRSVPRQRKPYPPLVEVVKNQPIFELHTSWQPRRFQIPRLRRGLERGRLPLPLHNSGQERGRTRAGVPDRRGRTTPRQGGGPQGRATFQRQPANAGPDLLQARDDRPYRERIAGKAP